MICESNGCGCAVTTTTMTITGSGTPTDPWVIDMAGSSDITQLQVDVANIFAALAALPGTYVDVTGDSMTGVLSITATVESLQLRRTTDGPHLGWYHTDGSRMAYIQALNASSHLRIVGESGYAVAIFTDGSEKMRILTGGTVLVGKSASNTAVAGVETSGSGIVTVSNASTTNGVAINKIGAGVASGTVYMPFQLSGTTIGTITRNAATSAVLYNTTSDENLKTVIEDLDPELAEYVLALVTPVMFSWNDDETDTPIVGYIAQQVARAWPQSVELGLVTPGVGDVADRTWDSEGNETTPEGVWSPWMMSPSVIIPLLHASLVRTTTKLSYLRAEFDELKARVEALEGA